MGRPITNMRPHQDQRGTLGFLASCADGAVDSFQIVAVFHRLRVPTIRREPPGAVFREGEVRRGRECDAVVIVQIDELPEFQVARQRSCFGCHAFHEVPVRR